MAALPLRQETLEVDSLSSQAQQAQLHVHGRIRLKWGLGRAGQKRETEAEINSNYFDDSRVASSQKGRLELPGCWQPAQALQGVRSRKTIASSESSLAFLQEEKTNLPRKAPRMSKTAASAPAGKASSGPGSWPCCGKWR